MLFDFRSNHREVWMEVGFIDIAAVLPTYPKINDTRAAKNISLFSYVFVVIVSIYFLCIFYFILCYLKRSKPSIFDAILCRNVFRFDFLQKVCTLYVSLTMSSFLMIWRAIWNHLFILLLLLNVLLLLLVFRAYWGKTVAIGQKFEIV